MARNLPIGLFDSGVGGLTVFRAVAELFPHENLIYLGDTARVPYGTKSGETITRYTLMAAGRLAREGVKLLVIACNTATAAALPTLREKFAPTPVVGVVEPGARAAVAASRNNHIAVIGTEATIRGQAYHRAIHALAPEARVAGQACTLLVSLAEEGWASGEIAEMVVRRYLSDIFREPEGPDTLLLGCTHFPLFMETFQKIAGPGISIVDSAQATARAIKRVLAGRNLLADDAGEVSYRFLTTDNRERFARAGSLFLGRSLTADDVELADL